MRALVLLALLAPASFDGPPLTGRVVDSAGALTTAQATELEAQLAKHEVDTGHQLAVVVVDTLAGSTIEQASLQTAERWRLGDAARDDGLLFFVALRERQMRVEVGYGLEGVVPDVVAGRILREQVTPRMAAGDIAGGILAGATALMQASAGEAPLGTNADDVDPFANISFVLLGQLLIGALLQRLPRAARALLLCIGGGIAGFALSGSLVVVAVAVVGGIVLGVVPAHVLWALSLGRGAGGGGGRGGFSGGGGRFGGGGASGRW